MLIIALIVAVLVCVFCFKKIQKLDKEIDELENELKKKVKIAEQKEKINSGDVESDFNASIELLQNYSDKRNKKLSKSNSKRWIGCQIRLENQYGNYAILVLERCLRIRNWGWRKSKLVLYYKHIDLL